MRRSYRLIIALLLFAFSICRLNGETKSFFVYKYYDKSVYEKTDGEALFLDYVSDYITESLSQNDDLSFISSSNLYDFTNSDAVQSASNYTKLNGGFGFLYFRGYVSDNNILRYDVSVYGNNETKPLLSLSYDFYTIDIEAVLLDASIFFENSLSQIKTCLDELDVKPIIRPTKIQTAKKKKERDFPLFGLSLMTTSVKLYFDQRTNSKIFSFFPVNITASFYPLRYMEVGLFFKINYDDMIFKYEDVSRGTNDYYNATFKFGYGFFIGVSFFAERYHYSFGLQVYNYHLYHANGWEKTGDYRSEFMPQFAFYQKIDVKIFKFLYYSFQISLKTLQKFTLDENNIFYSYPCNYDFLTVEMTLLGFSIIL